MATTTATIFVEHAHPYDGGINPTHFIQLTENNRPFIVQLTIVVNEKLNFLKYVKSSC